jgi:hypothetical protein
VTDVHRDIAHMADGIVKPALDTLSIGTVVATLVGYLPSIAALVSIVWGVIRILETHTVRRLMGKEPLK